MTILDNDFLKVSIRSKGAELNSILNKTNKIEHLWQGKPDIWNWHSPNLFPVVGGCLNNQIHVEGRSYPMERHGFARQSEFILIDSRPAYALFSLRFSDKSLAIYPYKFEFQILYTLEKQQLNITYRICNEDNKTVYFSVGAHPAFNVPFLSQENYTDYYLQFDQEENLKRHLLSKNGLFTGKTEPVLLDERKLWLSKGMFDQDALVFKELVSRKITLRSKNHDHYLTISHPDFYYLGVWAKPGAPFVCIEPWLGCADTEGKTVSIQEKEAIQFVNAGAIFEAAYSIGVY